MNATAPNVIAADEGGIRIDRIKIGNFVLTSTLGGFTAPRKPSASAPPTPGRRQQHHVSRRSASETGVAEIDRGKRSAKTTSE